MPLSLFWPLLGMVRCTFEQAFLGYGIFSHFSWVSLGDKHILRVQNLPPDASCRSNSFAETWPLLDGPEFLGLAFLPRASDRCQKYGSLRSATSLGEYGISIRIMPQ